MIELPMADRFGQGRDAAGMSREWAGQRDRLHDNPADSPKLCPAETCRRKLPLEGAP